MFAHGQLYVATMSRATSAARLRVLIDDGPAQGIVACGQMLRTYIQNVVYPEVLRPASHGEEDGKGLPLQWCCGGVCIARFERIRSYAEPGRIATPEKIEGLFPGAWD